MLYGPIIIGLQIPYASYVVNILLVLQIGENSTWPWYFQAFLVFTFCIVFNIGPGTISWLLGPELFYQNEKHLGISISVTMYWIAFTARIFVERIIVVRNDNTDLINLK